MPGIIVAILLKNMKNNMNVHLYEKSYHKSHFLKEVSKKLNLNTKVIQKNIFENPKRNLLFLHHFPFFRLILYMFCLSLMRF